jgi:hypothetical protein
MDNNLPWNIKKMTQVLRFRWNGSPEDRLEELVDREWPVIKRLCGYASATQSPLGQLRVLLSRDWAHRFLDYGLGSFQERLEFVARRRR